MGIEEFDPKAEWARYRMYRAMRMYSGMRPIGIVVVGVVGFILLSSGNIFADEHAAQNAPLGKDGTSIFLVVVCSLAILGGLYWISRIIRDINAARKDYDEKVKEHLIARNS